MAEAQADPLIRFIVTFGHKPAYSSGYHSGSSSLRAILDTLGVRNSKYVLNLNGHSHSYERSHPQFGVVHVTSGTGGTNLEEVGQPCLWAGGCPPPAWSAYRAMHHVALRLRFTATGIEGTVYCGPAGDTGSNETDVTCTEGTVLESFTIERAGPQPVVSAPRTAGALMGRRTLAAGAHQVELDGRDTHGDALPSGVYLYQVSLEDRAIAGKVLIVR